MPLPAPANRDDQTITLRVRGLQLTRAPQEVIDGWQVFYLNGAVVDWAESCNRARAQIFKEQLPAVDHKFNAIMLARLEAEKKKRVT